MSEDQEEKYRRDPNLQKAVDDVRKSDQFKGNQDFHVVAVFAKGNAPADREAASCRKISNAIRTVTGLDFLLVFWTGEWDKLTSPERHRLIVHEVNHIDRSEEDEPRVRRHAGDFCEIPEHDKECTELAAKIPVSSALSKFDKQATMTEMQKKATAAQATIAPPAAK